MTITFLKKRIYLPRCSSICFLGFLAFSCYKCTSVKNPVKATSSPKVLTVSTPEVKANPIPLSNKMAISQVEKNQLLGLIDSYGKELFTPKYTAIKYLNHKLFVVTENKEDSLVVVNIEGEVVKKLAPKSIINPFYKEVAILHNGSNKGWLINRQFEKIKELSGLGFGISPYHNMEFNENGYAQISAYPCKNCATNAIGLINEQGTIIIDFQYEYPDNSRQIQFPKKIIDDFWVCFKGDKAGVINIKGETIIPFEYLDIKYYGDEVFYVKKQISHFDSKFPPKSAFPSYWININGEKIIDETQYYSIDDHISDGLIYVRNKRRQAGMVNVKGEVVIPCTYRSLKTNCSSKDYIFVVKDTLGEFINRQNETTIPFQFKENKDCGSISVPFSDGWTLLSPENDCLYGKKDGPTYILTTDNETKSIGDYVSCSPINGGVSLLKKGDRSEFILHKDGTIIEVSQYDRVLPFQWLEKH